MILLQCINDKGYQPIHLQWIKQFPKLNEIYTLRDEIKTETGIGYLLEEISNPIMPNGIEPNFSSNRFKRLDDIDIDALLEECFNLETTCI